MAAEAFEGRPRFRRGRPRCSSLAWCARPIAASMTSRCRDEAHRGMGTTLTAVKVIGDDISLGHVGDSRAYRLRDGELEQLTHDHSLVAELERTGQITAEAAEHHPQRSIITRALGPEPDVEVDTYTVTGRGRRHLPALLRRPDRDGLRRRARLDPALGARSSTTRPRRSYARPTRAGAGTTSPSSCFAWARQTARTSATAWSRRRPRRRRSRGRSPPTTCAPPTPTPIRRRRQRAADRRCRSGRRLPGRRHRQAPAPRRRLRSVCQGVLRARRAGRRRCGPLRARAAGLLRRHQRRRPGDALPGRALRAAVRPRALRRRSTPAACRRARSRRRRRARARPRVARTRGRRRPGARSWSEDSSTQADVGTHPRAVRAAAGVASGRRRLRRRAGHPHRGRERRHAHLRRGVPRPVRARRTCSSGRGCRTPTPTCSRSPPCSRRWAW